LSQRLTNSDATELLVAHVELGGDAALEAAHVGLGHGKVLLAREQQGDVDRHAGEDRLLDGGNAGRRAGDLHVKIRPVGQLVDAARRLDGPCVSFAKSGDTSIETQPSTPPVRSNTGRNRSAARRRSSSAKSTNSPSPLDAGPRFLADAAS
jgi:hypothetical protein